MFDNKTIDELRDERFELGTKLAKAISGNKLKSIEALGRQMSELNAEIDFRDNLKWAMQCFKLSRREAIEFAKKTYPNHKA